MPPKKTSNLTFGEATSRAKEGFAVARESWSRYEMFAYILPEEIRQPANELERKIVGKWGGITSKEHWVLYTIHNKVIPWNPYGTDVLANDWKVYEIKPKEETNE